MERAQRFDHALPLGEMGMNHSETERLNELTEQLKAHRAKFCPSDVGDVAESQSPTTAASCPACGGEFEAGHVEIHGTFWGAIFVGFSYQHCWFVPEGRGEEIALRTDEKRKAHRCARCGTLVILGAKAGRL